MTQATLDAPIDAEAKPDDLRAQVSALSRSLDEPDWLLAFRLASLEQALTMEWWTGQEESWRRTPRERLPRRARVGSLGRPTNGTAVNAPPPCSLPMRTRAWCTRSVAAWRHPISASRPKPMASSSCRSPQQHTSILALVQKWLGAVGQPQDRYDAFGRALWTQGVFVYAPPGAAVSDSLFYLITQDVAEGDHWHYTLVVAERESELSLIEAGDADDRRAGLDETPLIHASVELLAEDGRAPPLRFSAALAPADRGHLNDPRSGRPRRLNSGDHRRVRCRP